MRPEASGIFASNPLHPAALFRLITENEMVANEMVANEMVAAAISCQPIFPVSANTQSGCVGGWLTTLVWALFWAVFSTRFLGALVRLAQAFLDASQLRLFGRRVAAGLSAAHIHFQARQFGVQVFRGR